MAGPKTAAAAQRRRDAGAGRGPGAASARGTAADTTASTVFLLVVDRPAETRGPGARLRDRLRDLGMECRESAIGSGSAAERPIVRDGRRVVVVGTGRMAQAAADLGASTGADIVLLIDPAKARPGGGWAAGRPGPWTLAIRPAARSGEVRQPLSRQNRRLHVLSVPVAGRTPLLDHLLDTGAIEALVRAAAARPGSWWRLQRLAAEAFAAHKAGRRRSVPYLVGLAGRAAGRPSAGLFRGLVDRLVTLPLHPAQIAALLDLCTRAGDADSQRQLLDLARKTHPKASHLRHHLDGAPDERLQILHDRGLSIVRYVESDPSFKRPLFVTFTGFEGDRSDTPGFGETFLRRLGLNCIAVKSVNRNNFDDLSVDDLAAVAGPIVRRHKTVVTYGQSGGAYAALYFSGAVGADLVLAVSPRNSRDPLYRNPTSKIPPEWTDSHRRIREVAWPTAAKLAIYDPTDRQDERYFRGELDGLTGLIPVRLRSAGHPCSEHLATVGALKHMVERVAAGDVRADNAESLARQILRLHRAGRGRSRIFLCHFAYRLGRARKTGHLRRLAARIDQNAISEYQLHRLSLGLWYAGLKAEYAEAIAKGRVRFPNSTYLGKRPWPSSVEAILDRLAVIAIRLGVRRPFERARPTEEQD